jgi:hypothetical protein
MKIKIKPGSHHFPDSGLLVANPPAAPKPHRSAGEAAPPRAGRCKGVHATGTDALATRFEW